MNLFLPSLLSFLSALAFANTLTAQTEFLRLTSKTAQEWRVYRNAEADYLSAARSLEKGPFDPAAAPLLNSASGYARALFGLRALSFVKAVTFHDTEGDGFVCSWTFTEPRRGTVIVRDTPLWSEFVFWLPDGLADSADLQTLLSELFRQYAPPLRLLQLNVAYELSLSGIVKFLATPVMQPSSFPLIRDFNGLSGSSGRAGFYLSMGLGKEFSRAYFDTPPFVPERFPPLSALVRIWTGEKIREELGKGPSGVYAYLKGERDSLLLSELVRRGLTEQEFVSLMTDVPAEGLARRAEILRRVAAEVRPDQPFQIYERAVLERYSAIGSKAAGAVQTVAETARCSAPLEAGMSAFLNGGLFTEGALWYLARCGSSAEALSLVSGAALTPEQELLRKYAVKAIRKKTVVLPK